NILLLEPNYKNKFPPIGLMKIATYFKLRGDNVVFYKGDLQDFVVRQITDDCVDKLTQLDGSINWRHRADRIATYIRYRRKTDLNRIGVEDSEFELLLTPWLDYYKNFYWKKEYLRHPKWDWVGVTTLFTFYWDITIETIEFAKLMVKDTKNIMVGGVLASIQPEEIEKATGIKPHTGTLHTPYKDIDEDNPYIIDELPLDYSILDEIDYVYPDSGAFYSYSTRGCIRHCPFCAVPTLEPNYQSYLPLYERIAQTRRLYGDQRNLLLMDNNVLASTELKTIIEDIQRCGFTKGAKYFEPNQYKIAIRNLRLGLNDRAYIRKAYRLLKDLNDMRCFNEDTRTLIYHIREKNGLLHPETCTKQTLVATYKDFAKYFDQKYKRQKGRSRYIDFNQGVDARLFTNECVDLLAQIPIRPLRIAFDDVKTEPAYTKALRMSVDRGIRDFSNYLLYNFNDKPQDLYHRLRVNVDLSEELDVSIYSFPMKYHPIRDEHSHDRDYIGKYWNRKYIRAVQAILNATKGKIGRGVSFFEKAFGKNEKEYMELLLMPETFLLFRFFFEHLGYTQQWREAMNELTDEEREELYPIIFKNDFNHIEKLTTNEKYRHILRFYKNYRGDIADSSSELYRLKQEFDREQKT
ncbi:MAG: cobalamin B12-binding domain-containing protein, partial [Paludibacteraceae bacterium]|nr:cobalamin B12-binding domain-containing protein [Paludibacteraceae bacterium]